MRVLVVRLGAMGDVIHTLPLATDLHGAGCMVDWLVEDRWASLLRGSQAIHRLHLLPRGAWRKSRPSVAVRVAQLRQLLRTVRQQRYDVVIDAQGLAKSAVLAALAGARSRHGHARPRAREGSWLLSRLRLPCTATHVVDQQRALGLGVLRRLGKTCGPLQIMLPPFTAERTWAGQWLAQQGCARPWVLNVGAGWPSKVWPLANQVAFAKAVLAAGQRLVVLWGGAAERALAEQVCAAAAGALLAPPTDIPQMAGLLGHAAVVVSGDTGPLHLAWALGRPCVGLFGPVPAMRNGPRGSACRCIQGPGKPWERHDPTAGGMSAIGAFQVMAAAQDCAFTHCASSSIL